MIALALRPEGLLDPGFQMSFAARACAGGGVPDPARQLALALASDLALGPLVVFSLVVGLATGPFAAAHFNRLPHFGLIANLMSVPVMGAVIMSAAVLAPLGLSWIGH